MVSEANSSATSNSAAANPSSFPPSGMTASLISFGHLITTKLTPENYQFWRAQLLSLLRSHLLMGYVDSTLLCPGRTLPVSNAYGSTSTAPNPAFIAWTQQDQAILAAILSSSTLEIAGMIMFADTSCDAWSTLESSFASQSAARSMQIRTQLAAIKKLDAPASVYFNKVKALSNTLTSIGQPLHPR